MNALPGYSSETFDDAVAADGSIRPAAREVMDAVLSQDLAALATGVREEIAALGITFGSVDGDEQLARRPGPARDRRAPSGSPWRQVSRSACKALNAFVADIYADRRIVAEGVLPQHVLDSSENVEPAMAGVRPRDGVWIGIAGLDLVRNREGEWLVLEDNVQTPSGIAYWVAAREAVLRGLDVPHRSDAARRHPRRAAPRLRRRPRGRGHRRA